MDQADIPVSVPLTKLLIAVLGGGKSFRLQARGFSMLPFIFDGDFITISPLPSRPPAVGEVVAFFRPGTETLVVHRAIKKANNAYWIKGDNIRDIDGLIPRQNIIGYVTKVERKGREVFLGMGRERKIIALCSRLKVISYLLLAWKILIPSCIRERIKCRMVS